MIRTIIESPYAGEVEANVEYARAAVRDSVLRGEAPIASHLLFTQPGILLDSDPVERKLGIEAGLAWRSVAEQFAFYINRGWSKGMLSALDVALLDKHEVVFRSLAPHTQYSFPPLPNHRLHRVLKGVWRVIK